MEHRDRNAGSAEERLARYRLTGDRHERNAVVEAHQALAEACARRFRHRGEPFDDLVQVAVVGVLKAAERYDPAHGVPFASFAALTARGELRRYHRDAGAIARVPRRLHDLVPSIAAAADVLRGRFGRSPTVGEVADHLGVAADEVIEASSVDCRRWQELLPDDDVPGSARLTWEERVVEVLDDRAEVERLLRRLPAELREVLRMRYLEGRTWAAIGAATDAGQQEVKVSLRRATRRLRARALEVPDDPTQASTA